MSKTLTHFLAGAVVVLTIAAVVAGWRLSSARAAALDSQRDLAATQAALADLATWHVTAGAGDHAADASDFNRRIRSAASAGGLIDHLVSVEPGPTLRVRDTDTVRTPVYLRLENVALRPLVSFLNGLTTADPAARVTGIDLSAPPAPNAEPGRPETWVADVTLSESAVAPAAGG